MYQDYRVGHGYLSWTKDDHDNNTNIYNSHNGSSYVLCYVDSSSKERYTSKLKF